MTARTREYWRRALVIAGSTAVWGAIGFAIGCDQRRPKAVRRIGLLGIVLR